MRNRMDINIILIVFLLFIVFSIKYTGGKAESGKNENYGVINRLFSYVGIVIAYYIRV